MSFDIQLFNVHLFGAFYFWLFDIYLVNLLRQSTLYVINLSLISMLHQNFYNPPAGDDRIPVRQSGQEKDRTICGRGLVRSIQVGQAGQEKDRDRTVCGRSLFRSIQVRQVIRPVKRRTGTGQDHLRPVLSAVFR
jgi:hypothetical protein